MSNTIEKSIEINASRETVWDVLFNEKYTSDWYQEFSEGSHAETDWKVGSKAVFTDKTQNGIVGKIIINEPLEALVIEYEGIVVKGEEDYKSDEAQQVRGARESYRLTQSNDKTLLSIEQDMFEGMEGMAEAWDRALAKVRKLAEQQDK